MSYHLYLSSTGMKKDLCYLPHSNNAWWTITSLNLCHLSMKLPGKHTRSEAYLSADITSFIGHDDFTLLTLYQKSSALSIGGFVLGSSSSRFVTTACVMATHPKHCNKLNFARIEYFAKLDNCSTSTISILTACVQFYEEHPCKLWFGGPTQVWTKTTLFDAFYIPLNCIKSRVAYSETSVNFGRIIGEQSVYVVSLLSN